MQNIKYFILLVTLTFSVNSNAQKIILRGNVTDNVTGEAISFATIAELSKDMRVVSGTVTDDNGNYTIEIENSENMISASYIGYETQTVEINKQRIIDFKLEPATVGIEEIMVVAERSTGDPLSNIAERDRTSATAKIDMQDMHSVGSISADDAMQGQLSGVDIITSGSPGSGSTIVIRGMGTLGNAKPLIVVDGIPQDVRNISDFDFSTADQEDIGDLVNISPQDIKSIEVLKDAASTAVWGSQGANGVLLIETLRGKKGLTKFTYQNKFSLSLPPLDLPLLNGDEYIMLQLEQLHAPTGIFALPPELSNDRTLLGKDYYNYTQNTNWPGYLSQIGSINDNYFKVSGGGERTNYFSSVNFVNENGTTLNTGLRRLTTRTNLDYRVSNKLSFSSNFSYSNNLRQGNYRYGGKTVREMAIKKAPNMSIWEYDEYGNKTGDFFTPIRSYQGTGTAYYNPIAMTELGSNDTEDNNLVTSFFLKYNILPWLTFQETISFTYVNSKRKQFLPYNAIGEDWLFANKNRADETNSKNERLLTRSQIFISPRFQGNHKLSSSLMFETRNYNSSFVYLSTSQSASTLVDDVTSNSVFLSSNSGQSVTKSIGGLVQLFYKYKDLYMLTGNLRLDGSSKFGIARRYGVFPSISAGWRFSEEPWLRGLTFLGESKFRISYGYTGNDRGSALGAYDRHAAYGLTSGPNAYIDNSLIVPLRIQLEKLKWEKISQWNLGIDLTLFDRLFLQLDVYDKITSDILWKNYNLANSSGFNSLLWYNGGKLQNQGWEIMSDYKLIDKSDIIFKLRLNISNNINRYVEFPDNFNNEVSIALGNGQYPRRAEIGQPIGSFYGLQYLGVWSDDNSVIVFDENENVIKDHMGNNLPLIYQAGGYVFKGGDAKYGDRNHDGIIDLNDVVYLGNANPKFEGGFGGNFSYKRIFRFSILFHARVGQSIVNMVAVETQGMNNYNNQSKAVLRRWRKPGDDFDGILPRAYFGNPVNNLGSDRYVEDGSYVRLNNISVSYYLPKKISNRIGVDQIEMMLTMRKLYTWTNYTGQDPEILPKNDPFWMGADTGDTPVPMRIVTSLSINF